MDGALATLPALVHGPKVSSVRVAATHLPRLPHHGSQRREPSGVAGAMSAGVALGAGLVIGGRRGGRMRVLAQRRRASQPLSGNMTEPLRKLQECLDSAVEAEASGEDLEAIAKAEEQAKAVVLLSKNGFQYFGKAVQAEKKVYTAQDMKTEQIDATILLTTEDTVAGVRNRLLSFFAISSAGLAIGFPSLRPLVLSSSAAILASLLVDLLLSQGALQSLIFDTLARVANGDYANRVTQAEAARFLVAYLIGVLPKGYSLSAVDALTRFTSTAIQAGCVFCNAQLSKEIQSNSLSSNSVDKLVCTKLAGVAQEYLMFQRAESGSVNLEEIEDLFKLLNFEKGKADGETRWAIVNVIRLLRRYEKVHTELAKAMERNAPVGECISIIERFAPECDESVATIAEEGEVFA